MTGSTEVDRDQQKIQAKSLRIQRSMVSMNMIHNNRTIYVTFNMPLHKKDTY